MPLERQSGASATAPRYVLDTDTCSYVMKRSQPLVLKRLQNLPVSDVCMSVVTKAELLYGVELSPSTRRTRLR
jgi:tRNA(fMet)-specific endonuclease VapC